MPKNEHTAFAALYAQAVAAAKAAAAACTPTPMVVSEAQGLSDLPKPGGKSWYVPDGVCGFAWVHMKATLPFARWAKAQGHARKGYPTGCDISAYRMAPEINQSLERGEAAARAAAAVLRQAGVECFAESRID